jgi:chromate transporter
MTPEPPSLRALTAASFRIGCLGFGGPAGQIALMHRIFVDEREWIDEERFLHALNFCMLLPGPEAQQLATYVGWRLHGVKGGLIAGLLFVAPGALVILALSWIYAMTGAADVLGAAFFGIRAAVLALVAEAMLRVGKRALRSRAALLIAAATFVVLWLRLAPFPLVILAAGVVGLMLPAEPASSPAQASPVNGRNAFAAAMLWGALWLAPPIAAIMLLTPAHVLAHIGVMFSTLAVVTFGGAYATLAYLAQQAVETQHWLSATQMIDGLGLAETTPGPLVLVNQFVGFMAGWNQGGASLALAGAAMASWCTFAPSFVWIFIGAPYAERLRGNARASAVLRAISAATLGVIASMALWFALHVLFHRIDTLMLGPATTIVPQWQSFDTLAAGIAAISFVLLFRFRFGPLALVLTALALGVACRLLGLV